GMWEYVKPVIGTGDSGLGTGEQNRSAARSTFETGHLGRGTPKPNEHDGRRAAHIPPLNRTPKLFIGGKQTRPDQGYVRRIHAPNGALVGEVGEGNRKDIRNAVEAAHSAWKGWGKATGHLRGQILYYIAENLAVRAEEFATRIGVQTGCSDYEASREI